MTIMVNGAGQRRITASLLLELSASNSKSLIYFVAPISECLVVHSRGPVAVCSDSISLHGNLGFVNPVLPGVAIIDTTLTVVRFVRKAGVPLPYTISSWEKVVIRGESDLAD